MLVVAFAGASRASALPGPASMSTGFVDLTFQQTSDSTEAQWLDRARSIGARAVRLEVYWSSIAPFTLPPRFNPSNPGDRAYDWSALDQAVKEATAAHMRVILLVVQAPTWAEGPGIPSSADPGSWEPSASAFAAFAHAIALRYSGRFPDPLDHHHELPHVSYFQGWNEPNLPIYLEPQWVQDANGAIVPESPILYRSLLNAFYSAVKAVQPRAYVLAAGTAPYGDPPGVDRMAPLVFLRAMFCLTSGLAPLPCPDPPHFDALDHHPYGVGPTVKARIPGDVALPDLGKIWRVLHAAQRVGHALPAGPKLLWVTELDWSSNPPNPAAGSLAMQAQNVSLALYEAWSHDVSNVFWFQVRDPLVYKRSFNGGGVYFADGRAKPAATAFKFAFVALHVQHHRKIRILWGRAPSAGTVVIERRVGRGWQTVLQTHTTAGGIFYARLRLNPRLTLRAREGGEASLPWPASRG